MANSQNTSNTNTSPPVVDSVQACLAVANKHKNLIEFKSLPSRDRHEFFLAKTYLVDNYSKFKEADVLEASEIFSRHMKIVASPEITEALVKKALEEKKALPFLVDFHIFKKPLQEKYIPKYLALVNDLDNKEQMKYYAEKYKTAAVSLFRTRGKNQSDSLIEAVLAVEPDLIVSAQGWNDQKKISWLQKNPEAAYKVVLQNNVNYKMPSEAKPISLELLSKAIELYLPQVLGKIKLNNISTTSPEVLEKLADNFSIFPKVFDLFEELYPEASRELLSLSLKDTRKTYDNSDMFSANYAQHIIIGMHKDNMTQVSNFFKRHEDVLTQPCEYMRDFYKRQVSFLELCFLLKEINIIQLFDPKKISAEEKKMLVALTMETFVKDHNNSKGVLKALDAVPADMILEYEGYITKQSLPTREQQTAWSILIEKKSIEQHLKPESISHAAVPGAKIKHKI